jgi:hypothetical protein
MPVKKTSNSILTLVWAGWFICLSGAFAAGLTNAAIEAKIKAAHIFKEEREIKADFESPVIRVNITSPYSETEKDKKINAVLIAKNVMALSKDAMRVRVRFFPNNQYVNYDQITVTVADVKYFADGKESPDALIKSIDIESGSLHAPVNTESSAPPIRPLTKPLGSPVARVEIVSSVAPQAAVNFDQLYKRSARPFLAGRHLSVAKGFLDLELAGIDTSIEHRLFMTMLKVENVSPNIAKGGGPDLFDNLRAKGYDRFHPFPPLKGAVDRLHWQDSIANLSSIIRRELGEDTPNLNGLNLGERVRTAALIHWLGERGQDVTVWRRRLLQIDEQCQSTQVDPHAINRSIINLEREMGFLI